MWLYPLLVCSHGRRVRAETTSTSAIEVKFVEALSAHDQKQRPTAQEAFWNHMTTRGCFVTMTETLLRICLIKPRSTRLSPRCSNGSATK